jgi:prefoldin subunit 5
MQEELRQLHDEQKEYAGHLQAQLKELSEELTAVESSRAETTKTINNIDKILK